MKKQVNRRDFLKAAGMTAGAAALVACTPKATEAPTEAPMDEPKEEPTVAPPAETIAIEIISYDADEVHQEAFQLFVDAHPDVEVTWSPVPGSWMDLLAKVNTRIAAGNPPDMTAVATYGPCITWGANGLLVNLQDYIDGDADFVGDPVPVKLLDLFTSSGNLYGIPKDYVPHAVIYNKGLFDAAGVEPPQPGWTWADVVEKAKAMTSGEGTDKVYGWMTSTGPWVIEQYFWGNDGPGLFDRRAWDFTTPTAADPKNIEALQFWMDTILVDDISPSPEALQALGAGDRQLNGKLAMWMSHTIDTVNLLQNTDKIDWQVVPNPLAYEGGPSFSMNWTSGFGIVSTTKNPEMSWEFVKHFCVGEGAKVLGRTGFSIPSGVPEAFLTDAMVERGGQYFLDAANCDVPANDSLGEFHNEMNSVAVVPHFEAAFLGQETAQEALEAIQTGMETLLEQNA